MDMHSEKWQLELYQTLLRQRSLPVYSPRIDEEAISSWIVRIADGLGMSSQRLGFWLFGRGRQLFGEDIDRGAWQELISALSVATRQPEEDLCNGTLRIYEGRLWGTLPRNGPARWILPIAKRGTAWNGHGVQYCPHCLASDAKPYIRLTWRLSFVVCCPKHHCLLSDRCWKCGVSVMPHKWRTGKLRDPGSSGILYCHACGADRRDAEKVESVSHKIEIAQARMMSVLDDGVARLADTEVNCLSFFVGAAAIWSMLDDARHAQALWLQPHSESPIFESGKSHRYGSFERFDVKHRALLLERFFELMADGAQGFVLNLKAHGYSSAAVMDYFSAARTTIPFWIWEPVHKQLDRTFYVPSEREISQAISYQVRTNGGQFARVQDVCRLLGMTTSNSKRVASAMQKMGALKRRPSIASLG